MTASYHFACRRPRRARRSATMRALWVIVLAGCYAPSPKAGSPCEGDADCPSSLVCSPASGTCETTASSVDAPIAIDAPLVDGCTPVREICGNGVDEDCDTMDPACAANDVAGGAVDVTAGGVFTGNALLAKDDVAANGCGANGGRDLFFQVELAAPQVYCFETFGADYDTVIRVYTKACSMVGSGAGAAACVDDACGGNRGHVAASLPAGRSCIVIDQRDADEEDG